MTSQEREQSRPCFLIIYPPAHSFLLLILSPLTIFKKKFVKYQKNK